MPESESDALPYRPAAGGAAPLALFALLSLAYVVTGRLGLLVAVPPGYASAVFPPAGIAAAAVLIYGRMALPWVFLGALVLNVWIGRLIGAGFPPAVLAGALLIAVASVVQAVVVATALRRAIGYPMALDNGHDLLRFVCLAPVCCVTSAVISLSGLWALGLVPARTLPASLATWWVGDTLGVLVVLPLVLVVAGEPRPLWRSRALPVALPMLLFFGFFVAVFVRVSAWEDDQLLLEFRLRSQETVDRVRTRLEEQEIFLEQLARSFSRGPALTEDDFVRLAAGALQRFSALRAVAWAPRVEAAPAPAAYPVAFVVPSEGAAALIGLNLVADPARAAAHRYARDNGGVAATEPLQRGGERVIDLLLAVRDGANGSGLLLAVLRVGDFVRGVLGGTGASLDLRLVDLAARQPLFDGFPSAETEPVYRQILAFGGRRYEVETVPSASYLAGHRGWESWALLAAGVFGTGLLGTLLMLGTGYASRIERQVEARTGDLAAVNRRLRVEIDERRAAEAALRHAQRMEAIGQLTGGIAHDFNNLLTVIGANAELIRRDATDEASRRRSGGILRAAERGERLTRQLLAYSRRQMLRPERVDLRRRTAEMGEMLERSMRSNIEVVVAMPDDLWPVTVDPAEFELAVLNIAVNARDAMPNGGRFRIAAENRTIAPGDDVADGLAGDFVALTLSDTGAGMAPEVLARAFEPYFTTKPVGDGSGLGLSQVYGFASQSGGTAVIESAPGAGTSITLFLPRALAAGAVPARAPSAAPSAPLTILVVEDEAEIAELTMAMLEDIGYRAIHVPDAAAALAALAGAPDIGLVISDIVMPGAASGLDLARALREDRPDLPVLLVTGYSEHNAAVADEAFDLLEKPYRREALAAAVRGALQRQARRVRGAGGAASHC